MDLTCFETKLIFICLIVLLSLSKFMLLEVLEYAPTTNEYINAQKNINFDKQWT